MARPVFRPFPIRRLALVAAFALFALAPACTGGGDSAEADELRAEIEQLRDQLAAAGLAPTPAGPRP